MVRGMEELTYKINKKPLPANRVFNLTVNILLIFIVVIVVYPLYFVLIASVSDPAATNTGRVIFLPVKIGFEAYKRIFSDKDIWTGYYNTILYTLGGTVFGLFSTITAGYSLSRKDLPGRGLIAGLMVFTMYFSGGLIPTYMVIKAIGLVNTRTVLMIYGCFSVYNLIICKTYFEQNIPDELFEAASIDGCGNGLFFFTDCYSCVKSDCECYGAILCSGPVEWIFPCTNLCKGSGIISITAHFEGYSDRKSAGDSRGNRLGECY